MSLTSQRVLCCCEGGNTRSVTLATLLKYSFRPSKGHDALPCSLKKNSPETLVMLFLWADRILVTDTWMIEEIRPEFRSKVSLIPIGPDEWGMSMHPELVRKAFPLLEAAGYVPKRTAEDQIRRNLNRVWEKPGYNDSEEPTV